MCVKFGLKMSNRLGKNGRKPQGDFFTHKVYFNKRLLITSEVDNCKCV